MAILATMALLAVGCPPRSTVAPAAPGGLAPIPLPPLAGTIPPPVAVCGPQFTASELVGAMVSVRLHVTVNDVVMGLGNVLPLEQAACIIDTASGLRAKSRRARAIAMLVASLEAERPPVEDGSQRQARVRAALERLGMTPQLLQDFHHRVTTGTPALADFDLSDIDLYGLRAHAWRIIKEHFAVPLDVEAGMACWNPLPPDVPPVQNSEQSVTLATKAEVFLPLRRVRPHIDPQSWDSCGDMWRQARLMDWVRGEAVPEANPPSPGENHPTKNLMQEEFVCGAPCGVAEFRLLLCTRTRCFDPAPPGVDCQTAMSKRFRVDFEIPHEQPGQCCPNDDCVPVCSPTGPDPWWLTTGRIGGTNVRPCIDDGWIEATLGGNSRTVVEARKTLHFDPASVDELTAAVYSEHWEELNDELGELACCLP
jgi:hypothetical protein